MGKKEVFLLVMLFLLGVALIFWYNCPSQQISGVVAEVEYNVEGSSFGSPDIKQTIIRFEDGRVKVFSNIKGVVQEGKFNIISYSRAGEIVCVEIK